MLSFLRKHQYGFMLVVAIVVIIAFTFFYDRNDTGAKARTETVFSVYGKDYNEAHLQHHVYALQLAQQLGMYDLIGSLYGERVDGSPQDFVYNLIILRKEAGKLGIHASQQEIEAKIRELPAFSPGGSFDQAAFDNLKTRLGSFGFTVEDLYNLVGDSVALDRLRNLLTASFTPPALEVEDAFASRYAKVSAYRIDFPADLHAADITVTDEEIAAYFEEHKASLRSEPRRSIEYVHFTQPDFSTPPVPTPPAATIPIPGTTPEATPGSAPEAAPATTPEITPEAVPGAAPATTPEASPDATPTPAPDAATGAAPATTPETTPEAAPEESGSSCQGGDTEDSAETVAPDSAVAADPVSPAAVEAAPPVPAVEAAPAESPLDLGTLAPGANADALEASANLLDDPSVATPTLPAGPTQEERTAAMLEYQRFMDEFITEASVVGSDFRALAEARAAASASLKHGAVYGSTGLLTQSAPPEDLKNERELISAIFAHPATKAISNPVRVTRGFYIFRLTGDEPPHDLTLEEATEKIREILKKEKQVEAVKKAATDAREKIMAGLKGGAKFAEAASAAGFEATRIPSFTGSQGPKEVTDFYTHLREPIIKTAAGQISEPHMVEQSAVLVYVASRVVPESPENEANRKLVVENLINQQYSQGSYAALMFKAWLNEARAAAKPEPDDLRLGRNVF